MTQDTFFDWCSHFINHLAQGQGKNGAAHFLFLDGHASRWNLVALKLLMEHNVYPFFLPSHTSVWTQPNDCGCNLRFHKCVEDSIKRLWHSGRKNTIWFYNVVLTHAWADYLGRERRELINAQSNTTTSSWETTGFFPFNPHPEAWRNVLSTLGTLNKELKKRIRMLVMRLNTMLQCERRKV